MSKTIQLTGQDLKLADVRRVAVRRQGGADVKVELAQAARERVRASRRYIESRMSSGEAIYGVNTGFGAFSSVRISPSQIVELQKNLIRSHSVGVGELFSREQARAILLLRANALARGHSGIRETVIDKLLEFLNHDLIPAIPQQGSVGASGDLAPLSHLALAVIGEGEVFDPADSEGRKVIPVTEALARTGVKPLELQAKEGLSMINGCQVMTAVGLLAVYEARRLAKLVDLAGAMSLEAMKGSRSAFDPLIPATRPHAGEAMTARNLKRILGETSPIAESHAGCGRVQDAYSLRCMPAVHGAAKDAIRRGLEVLEIEANSSTDNPLVFADEGKILSCGNFHGEPVAFQLDFMAIAMAAMASISECRIEKLINPAMSGLPAFLAPEGGLNSGHMIVQVAAAALVSENKILSHPASVDSIPTSADKEDHVSMGTIASRKFQSIVRNAESILAMELLAASQGLDLVRADDGREVKSAGVIAQAHARIRQVVPFAQTDRVFQRDIEALRGLVRSGELLELVENSVGELEC
ncbi:MAG TPA: histidine ammonia-lyase [Pseudobdellovibrionaceae bacterium]|nr:histidine ammonia-lyase [Pseudobdellovibrionaceae bacterium]